MIEEPPERQSFRFSQNQRQSDRRT